MTSTRSSVIQHETIEIALRGRSLLDNALFNKGSAFSEEERRELGLLGLVPPHVSSVEEQLARTYESYKQKETDLDRYIYLASLQDRNERLFYMLLREHIAEMMPIIYTPGVGEGCRQYSHIYRRPRGLYIPYNQRNEIDSILRNSPNKQVDIVVVTDGERILGLGDLGIGGMGIPIGKLALYTLCAGVPPWRTLPIILDVGTDNEELLNDPLYLGLRHKRIRGKDYDDFIESFVEAIVARFPDVVLQWEDFSKNNASRLLERYRDRLCTFNDDIQGTGAVTLAGLLVAMQSVGLRLSRQQVVILGAGSSATGISEQIMTAMIREGVTQEEARSALWLLDSRGLVHSGRTGLEPLKQRFVQDLDRLRSWKLAQPDRISLLDVVSNLRPTILIGTSAQPGAFTREIVQEMAKHAERPVIFPLSNPTMKSEAVPLDLINWTDGRALVATGSPFPPVVFEHQVYNIGQCNNSFIFPGVGLGVIASGARRITNELFVAAAHALAEFSPALHQDGNKSLYPALEHVRRVSRCVALAVGDEASRLGLSQVSTRDQLRSRIEEKMWTPHYPRYVRPV